MYIDLDPIVTGLRIGFLVAGTLACLLYVLYLLQQAVDGVAWCLVRLYRWVRPLPVPPPPTVWTSEERAACEQWRTAERAVWRGWA